MIVPKKTSSFQASPGNRPSPCPGSRVLHALLPLEQPPELEFETDPMNSLAIKQYIFQKDLAVKNGLAVLPSQNMLRQIGWSTTSHSQTPFPPPAENAESSSNFLALHDWNGSTEPPCQHWIWPCVRRYWLLPWQPVGWLNSKCPLHFCKRKTGRLEKPSGQKLWSRETWSWCLQRIAASLQTEPCGVCEKMEDIGPSASEICEKKSQNEARKFGCRLSGSYLNLHIAFD